jgi:hypothetical protein
MEMFDEIVETKISADGKVTVRRRTGSGTGRRQRSRNRAGSSMEAAMRLTASDFMTYWRPSPCELRVFLHEKGEPEAEPGAFDEVMRRLGIRHEQVT